jgi:hypothetical protein
MSSMSLMIPGQRFSGFTHDLGKPVLLVVEAALRQQARHMDDPFIGARISRLILARKSVLARLTRSHSHARRSVFRWSTNVGNRVGRVIGRDRKDAIELNDPEVQLSCRPRLDMRRG